MAGSSAKQALLLCGTAAVSSVASGSASAPQRQVMLAERASLSTTVTRQTCDVPVSIARRPQHLQQIVNQLRGGSQDEVTDDSYTPRNETSVKNKPKKKKTRSKKAEPSTTPDNQSTSASSQSPGEPTLKATETKKPSTLPSAVLEILKQDDYYEILGLHRASKDTITERAITKAYRRRCVLTHPDKTNGDRRAFDKVAEAYNVLSDPQKRAVYDRYGKAGLEQGAAAAGGGGFASADEFFQSFFGGTGPSFFGAPPPQQRARRNRTIRYQMEVSLEDLYKGMTQSIQIGAGGGSPLKKTVSVDIPRGAQDGQAIRLSGEIDFETTEAPGDLIFQLKQRPHLVFTRKGHDLAVIINISLQEAVCGVKRSISHVSGERLVIGSARKNGGSGDPVLIQTGDVHVLKGKGMPKDKLGASFGDLYVQYQVDLPSMKHDLTEEERVELKRLLCKLEGIRVDDGKAFDESKIQYFQPAKASDFGYASGSPPPLTPDEEDFHHDDGASGNPFSPRSFFYSSSNGREFPFGFPFEREGDDVQCRQM
jgi:DnaJ-class molecular chaperone